MRIALFVLAAFALAIAAPAFAGPFSDVPAGHWAYKAIEKSVEAGILQGYDGSFHGNKTLNRYQMAVVVARMLDRIETMGPGKISKKDIENLEALTIEFADELALLNVKVSTLEDGFAELKKDVDGLKKDFAGGGAKAGISGLFQARWIMTD
ncbi:MAG: S-layer homology domain-containing protein, partial [Candidatus Wallbacteria bacterium]|nr:S-layer homology domain-containing protein [Candidatus Wallbacteria bacterium]